MKISKISSNFSSLTNRLVFFAAGGEGPKAKETVKAPDASKEKSDVSTPAGREQVYKKAEELIQQLRAKAEEMKKSGDPQAKAMEARANRLQHSLDAAREENRDYLQGRINSDESAKYTSQELVKTINAILHPSKAPGAAVTGSDLAALAALDSGISPGPAKPKPAAAPESAVSSVEQNYYNPPQEVKISARNYASNNPGFSGNIRLADKSGVEWNVSIVSSPDPDRNGKITYRRISPTTAAPLNIVA